MAVVELWIVRHLVAPLMDTVTEKQGVWKSRDAWFCVLALIVFQFVILFWLRFAARSSPAFDHWVGASSFGTGVIYLIQDALWVVVALWFSRVKAFRDFLEPAGLRRGVSIFGWCAAWLAIAIAFVDAYGASRGLTASSSQHHAAGYGAFRCVVLFHLVSGHDCSVLRRSSHTGIFIPGISRALQCLGHDGHCHLLFSLFPLE